MNTKFQVFYSNRVENLFKQLKYQLFPSHPFTKRLIVVPSQAMKTWLMQQMAEDRDLSIATGVEISYLDQIMQRLIETLSPFSLKLPSQLELSFAIENFLRNHLDLPLFQPISSYLKIDKDQKFSKRTEKRLGELAENLALQFVKYGNYGKGLIREWENTPLLNWQQAIWQELFFNQNKTYPYKAFSSLIETPINKNQNIQLHLFATSYISPLQHQFFTHISKNYLINYYMLSPCHLFWSDIVSDKERERTQKYWKEQGASKNQLETLDEYLRDRNALLANFGKLGKKMAQQIEEGASETYEEYLIKPKAIEKKEYSELIIQEVFDEEKDTSDLSLLEAIQTDLLLLRNPENSTKINIDSDDQSIQVHIASSKIREIEILYNALMNILKSKHDMGKSISPGQILVLAPNIKEYIPFIKAVFHRSSSQLKVQIMDVEIPAENKFIQEFLHLLNLSNSRWEASSIAQLFKYQTFQRKWELNQEEIHLFSEWIKSGHFRWGTTLDHRNEILKESHCRFKMIEESPFGTWNEGIGLLINSLIKEEESLELSLEITQATALGKFIRILKSLKADLTYLNTSTYRSVFEWASYLDSLLTAYFIPEEEDLQLIKKSFQELSSASKDPKEVFPFISIKNALITSLSKLKTHYRENTLDAVKFCSLLPMRAIPAEVIAIIGMQEGEYPRERISDSLNEMHGRNDCDYCPSQLDFDRFLFLETLLSARSHFVLSYIGYEDAKETPPSLLITELFSYIDNAYLQDENIPSKKCITKHPYYAFDPIYFSSNSSFPSYSVEAYRACLAFSQEVKTKRDSFIPKFGEYKEQKDLVSKKLHLHELAAFSRNPLKSYFNKTLGIYVETSEERIVKDEEDFELTHLQKYLFVKDGWKEQVNKTMTDIQASGRLSLGAFKPIAEERLKKEISTLQQNLKSLNLSFEEISSMIFSEHYEEPIFDNNEWKMPPLKIKYGEETIEIIGSLKDVTTKGLITLTKDDPVEILKIWPQYLVFCCLIQQYKLPHSPNLFFIKGIKGRKREPFFENPEPLLFEFLHYFFLSKNQVSPLIPEWIPELINGKIHSFSEKVKNSLENPFQPQYNQYLTWTMKGRPLPDIDHLFIHWQPQAKRLFAPLYENWYV